MGLTIGIDVGGTKVAAGVVDEKGKIVEKLRRSTPAASPDLTATVISDAVNELLGRHAAEAVGIGAGPAGLGRQGLAGGGDCNFDFGVAVGGAKECGFELGGGEPDAGVEHGAVETAEGGGV